MLAPDVLRWLHPAIHVVALHASGDLHLRLLDAFEKNPSCRCMWSTRSRSSTSTRNSIGVISSALTHIWRAP